MILAENSYGDAKRLAFAREAIGSCRPRSVLDVGCGSGDLLTAPRLKNPRIPKAINDIVLKAMAPEITARYQRASELLDEVLAARGGSARRTPRAAAGRGDAASDVEEIQTRLKARETPQASFCWNCRKPLQARTGKCPFCSERQ